MPIHFDFLKLARENSNAMDEFKKWIDLSVKFGSYEDFLMPVVQGLGRFSLYSDEIDKSILLGIQSDKKETIEFSSQLTDAYTLSYLWVLGAYEAIRTLSQKADEAEKEGKIEKNNADKIRAVKHKFEDIRMPLAKMEIRKKNQNTDYNGDFSPIAYPILDAKRGIAWSYGQGRAISRKQLSEILLGLVDIDFEKNKQISPTVVSSKS